MRLLSLSLQDFRNYATVQLDVSEGLLHLFVGKNASGKTNLLDAVAILSQGASALGLQEEDLVRRGREFYRVRGEVAGDNGEGAALEVTSQLEPRRKKACFRNDVKTAAADFVGLLPTVLFLPQDLDLFTGAPAERRRFLDNLLSQVSPAYYRALGKYQQLLKQRNTLLKRIANREAKERDLEPWDAQLAEEGSVVTLARLELIETFTLTLGEELRALGEAWEAVRLEYRRKGKERSREGLAREMVTLLEAARERDILLQSTSVGPHRDDWGILINGLAMERFASRGQQRAAVVALLFLEASYLELKRGERPVILLDDVFSELDDLHRERVAAAFPQNQVFLTSTHLPPSLVKGAVLWSIEEGTVRKM
ncbi:MAG: DNA replication/repair protein RecF [Candidatus Peribacteraceae bacterium]|jgi:DNA replication and repair protein RecF